MKEPDLDNLIETFIQIPYGPDATQIAVWQDYVDLLRTRISPLIRDLQDASLITWFAFLVHNRQSGVPTEENDQGIYVHLRLEAGPGVNIDDLVGKLPEWCTMTRKMPTPPRTKLDNCDVSFFRGGRVENGWRVLGEGSAWILSMLESHDPDKPIPPQNVSQLLHYIGNSLFASIVRIPMP